MKNFLISAALCLFVLSIIFIPVTTRVAGQDWDHLEAFWNLSHFDVIYWPTLIILWSGSAIMYALSFRCR